MPFLHKPNPPSSPSPSPSPSTETKPANNQLSLRNRSGHKPRKTQHSTNQPITPRQPSFAPPQPTYYSARQQQEPHFIWEDINPPAEFLRALDQPQDEKTMVTSSSNLSSIPGAASLPGYNDVSGAVIVDWDGHPRFLSPQEERERKIQLEQAVRERMLGLPRRTDFVWEPSSGPILPPYSPAKEEKRSSPSPCEKTKKKKKKKE
ncbi:hypothetical protein ARAM_001497 [Aspergillus rambellii]|uniref:Uncharacterized protein n=1 Tax=Aspergillus rambellii TaxID=308745 RepID=A0A0F8X5Y4_9EURO|nr:hypothetical protein ARAM_001497 [Aspergillus rambellii]